MSITLPQNYRPTERESFMNPMQQEYFRQKLLKWKNELIEESKGKSEYGKTLRYLLANSLKLLHPFMPFITEEIWQEVNGGKSLLMIETWPS